MNIRLAFIAVTSIIAFGTSQQAAAEEVAGSPQLSDAEVIKAFRSACQQNPNEVLCKAIFGTNPRSAPQGKPAQIAELGNGSAAGKSPPTGDHSPPAQGIAPKAAANPVIASALGRVGIAGAPPVGDTQGWQFSAYSDTGKASFTYNRDVSSDNGNNRHVIAITASVALPGVGKETNLSAIDTLLSANSINASYTFIGSNWNHLRRNTSEYDRALIDVHAVDACIVATQAVLNLMRKKGMGDFDYAHHADNADLAKSISSSDAFFHGNVDGYDAIATTYHIPNSNFKGSWVCTSNFLSSLVQNVRQYYTSIPQDVDDELNKIVSEEVDNTNIELKFSPVFAVSVDGTIGYTKFDYFDPASLAAGSVTRAVYAFGLDGYAITNPYWSFDIGYHHQIAYRAGPASKGKQATICLSGTSPTLTCQTGLFGAPALQVSDLVDAELRWLPTVLGHTIGFAPKFTYDLASKVYKAEAPLYLVGDTTGTMLTGGVRYDWTSDTGSTVGVFVSTPLCVFAAGTCGTPKGSS